MILYKEAHRVFRVILPTAVIAYFLYLMIPWRSNELWNDEIYTLEKFTFVPISQIVSDYHAPNNHILYNIFDHCYLALWGIHDMRTVMEHPWILRLPLLGLSLATLLLMYKTARLTAGSLAGILSVAILATSIPFQNFCLQVRGYGFSMFFDLLLIYAGLNYVIQPKRRYLLLMVFSSFAAVYTIPSNLYCTIALIAYLGLGWVTASVRIGCVDIAGLKPLVAVVTGVAIAILCYLPVFHQVFYNVHVMGSASAHHLGNWNTAMYIYDEIITGRRYWILLFIVCGALYILFPSANMSKAWQLIFWQFLTPFTMVFLRGEHPPERVFTYLCVFLNLLLAINLAYIIRCLSPRPYHSAIVCLLVLFFIAYGRNKRASIDRSMKQYPATEVRTQGINDNYYLQYFHPLELTRYLIDHGAQNGVPVILRSSEPHDMPDYLRAFDIPYHSKDSIDHYLSARKKIFLITVIPGELDSAYMAAHHCTGRQVPPLSYHRLMELDLR